MRAALGVYEDLSLTARNDAEARLMLAMQGCPANYHKHPGVHPIYENAESVFSAVAPGTFVGPDGVSYGDPYVARWREGISAGTRDWMSVAKMLELISGWSVYMGSSGGDSRPGWLERILGAIGDMLVGTAHAQGRGLGGSRGRFARRGGLKTPKRGAGSNPRRKPVGRNGAQAHTQAHARRPVKSNKNVRFKGVKVKIPKRFREHMDPGHGARGREIKGAHTAEAFKAAIKQAGGEYRRVGTHPADARIKKYEYVLPNGATGKMRPYNPATTKTTYNMPKSEFQDLVRQAVKNALIRSNGKLPNRWTGVTRTGLKMRGFARPVGKGYEITTAWFEW